MEIERKFLVRKLPDLSSIQPVHYERYYLHRANGVEKRIQKRGEVYEFEELEESSSLSRTSHKRDLTEREFEFFKKQSDEKIVRDSYVISTNPEISIKVYHERFEGFARVEVKFSTEEEAQSFEVPDWFGEDITYHPLGRDSKLVGLSDEEFRGYLEKL